MKQFTNPKTGKVDYLNGDHSFKQFWKIMATNNKYKYVNLEKILKSIYNY